MATRRSSPEDGDTDGPDGQSSPTARPEILVDTGAWVAATVTDDAHHVQATAVYRPYLARYRWVTTNLIIAESYILLRRAAGHRRAVAFLERVAASPRVRKIHSDARLEGEAEAILRHFKDQDFSFTDAVSFALMRDRGMEAAFAFDTHFHTMGFRLLPADET